MERRQLIDLINKYAGYAQSQLIREKLADAILAELNEHKEKEFCTCINKPDVYIESLEPPIARCSQCGKIYKNSKD